MNLTFCPIARVLSINNSTRRYEYDGKVSLNDESFDMHIMDNFTDFP